MAMPTNWDWAEEAYGLYAVFSTATMTTTFRVIEDEQTKQNPKKKEPVNTYSFHMNRFGINLHRTWKSIVSQH